MNEEQLQPTDFFKTEEGRFLLKELKKLQPDPRIRPPLIDPRVRDDNHRIPFWPPILKDDISKLLRETREEFLRNSKDPLKALDYVRALRSYPNFPDADLLPQAKEILLSDDSQKTDPEIIELLYGTFLHVTLHYRDWAIDHWKEIATDPTTEDELEAFTKRNFREVVKERTLQRLQKASSFLR